jgi:hypothetical protein
MATPAKAFIDPTGVLWGPSTHLTLRAAAYASSIKPFGSVIVALQPKGFVPNLTLGLLGTMTPYVNNVKSKIPPPPMGRMLFATFPPIYKEKVKYAISTGQLYPPRAQ